MQSINKKLILSNLLGIISVLLISIAGLTYFSDYLIKAFIEKNEDGLASLMNGFNDAATFAQDEIVNIYEEQARKKGLSLIEKDTMSLTTPFIDNQVLFIQEFITKTLKLDDDIVYAGFYLIEGQQIRAIKIANRQFPDGIPDNLIFDMRSASWKSEGRSPIKDIAFGKIVAKPEKNIHLINYPTINERGEDVQIQAYEVYAPVYEGGDDDLTSIIDEGDSYGFLRYIISLEKTQSSVSKTQHHFANILADQDIRNNNAKKEVIGLSQKLRNTLFIVLFVSSLIVLLVGYLLSSIIAGRISEPIISLSNSAKKIASGNYDEKIERTSRDEIGQLCSVFDDMRVKIKSFTENLQQLVNEKTGEIRFLLDNVDIAIFKVLPQKKLGDEFSQAAFNIFGNLRAINSHELFRKMNAERTSDVLETMMEENELTFDVNRRLLPFQLKLNDKCLELTYSPHYDENSSISSILVTAKDVTEFNKLKVKAEEEAERGQFILNIATHGTENIRRFINNEISYLGNNFDSSKTMRLLHTAKGNSLAFGFNNIADKIHGFEDELRKLEGANYEKMGKIYCEKTIAMYQELESTINQYFPEDEHFGFASRANLYLNAISQFPRDNPQIKELYDLFYKKCYISFTDLLTALHYQLKIFSQRLKKPAPIIEVPEGIWIKRDIEHVFRSCLNHIIRNSLDHGIESPEERLKKGKSKVGTISLTFESQPCDVIITIKDDGAGLDLQRIASINQLDESIAAKDIANHIFDPGFSTKADVTEISGRGIGMDAIKADIEELGGSIEVIFQERHQENHPLKTLKNKSIPFLLSIYLPKAYFNLTEDDLDEAS